VPKCVAVASTDRVPSAASVVSNACRDVDGPSIFGRQLFFDLKLSPFCRLLFDQPMKIVYVDFTQRFIDGCHSNGTELDGHG